MDISRLEKFTSPVLIPLPPSPPLNPRITSRKPEGWISTIPRLSSSRFSRFIDKEGVGIGSREEDSGLDPVLSGGGLIGERVDRERDGSEVANKYEGDINGLDESHRMVQGDLSSLYQRYSVGHSAGLGRFPNSGREVYPGRRKSTGKRVVSGAMQYALLPKSPTVQERSQEGRPYDKSPSSPGLPEEIDPGYSKQTNRIQSSSGSISSPRSEMIVTPFLRQEHYLDKVRIVQQPQRGVERGRNDEEAEERPIGPDGDWDEVGESSFQSVSEIPSVDDIQDEYGLDRGHLDGRDELFMAQPDWMDEAAEEREAEEEWMGYVRSQLNAICPDFQPAEYPSEASTRNSAREGLGGNKDSWTPTPAHYPKGDYLSSFPDQESVGTIPTEVKGGMLELREEMERLRKVVGHLAEGLGGGSNINSVGANDVPEQKAPSIGNQPLSGSLNIHSNPRTGYSEDEQSQVIQRLLLQNSDQIISIISSLEERLHPGDRKPLKGLLASDNLVALQAGLEAFPKRKGC